MVKLSEVPYGKLLEKDYEKALSLQNKYSFINANVFPLLSKEEQNLLSEFEENCSKLAKDPAIINSKDDVYPAFPKFGDYHMVQRMNPFDGIEGSCKHQMLLSLAQLQVSPEIHMAIVAGGVLVGNSLFHNPKRSPIQEKALEEIFRGTKIAGISITEMDHGSDAVNMQTMVQKQQDGSLVYNGTKIYTTNGAVADYLTIYGVTDISDPRRTMALSLFNRNDPGLSVERLHIPAAPGVGIAKVIMNNVLIPPERIVAPPGEGYKRLFRGLTPERNAIIGTAIAGIWGALAAGTLFAQVRTQFGKTLFSYQGISHLLADYYAKLAALTAFGFQVADFYDKKINAKIHRGETPDPVDEGTAAIMAAQGKYLGAKLSAEAAYEIVQTMGGRGAIDEPDSNNQMCRGENVSRISEVVGGHRNIQLMIIEAGLRGTTAMAVQPFVDKALKGLRKESEKITEITLQKAEDMLTKDADKMGEIKGELEKCVSKLKTAIESKNKIELEAYAKALPKLVGLAGKNIYQAKKGVPAPKDD